VQAGICGVTELCIGPMEAKIAMLELVGETTKLGCRQGQFTQLTVL
jgi:hypothetical protein